MKRETRFVCLCRPHSAKERHAFTILEVLVACTILALMLGLVLAIVGHTGEVWRKANSRIEMFKGARLAFANVTQSIEQATLGTYWDYDSPNSPKRYVRRSELHFVTGAAADLMAIAQGDNEEGGGNYSGQAVFFQAPANNVGSAYDGVDGLLNACGFYVEYGSNANWLPDHVAANYARQRYRLFQWMQKSEEMSVYQTGNYSWIKPSPATGAFPLADNVITLVIWPAEEGGVTTAIDSYSYDSRENAMALPQPVTANQLPPVFQVALVAMDEASAERLEQNGELKSVIDGCLNGLFHEKPSLSFDRDMAILEGRLTDANVAFQVYFTSIPMREAKWSSIQ